MAGNEMAMAIGKETVNAITGEMMSDVTAVIGTGVAIGMMIMAGEDMDLVMMTTAVHVGRIEMVVVERTEETSGALEVVSVSHKNVARRRPKAALPSPSGSGKPQGGMFTLRATSNILPCKPNKQVCLPWISCITIDCILSRAFQPPWCQPHADTTNSQHSWVTSSNACSKFWYGDRWQS